MKKLIITILLMAWAGVVESSELLVQAKTHWMDEFTQKQVDEMTIDDRRAYEARAQIGDIIATRPDKWPWGKEERLPNYLVIKVPQMKLEEAKKYEEPLYDITDPENPFLLRKRKYQFSKAEVETAKLASLNAIQVSKAVAVSNISTKTGQSSEVIQPKTNLISHLKYYYRKVEPYVNVAYNYWVKNAFASQFLYKVVAPSGGDYTALETCMNANEQDLTGDGWFDVEIDGTWSSADTTAVYIENYTTTADDYINIYTTTTAGHKGVYSSSYYHLEMTPTYSVIDSRPDYITFTGLQIKNTNDSNSSGYTSAIQPHGSNTNINRCILIVDAGYVVHVLAPFTNLFNSILIGNGREVVYQLSYDDHVAIYNCTLVYTNTGNFNVMRLGNTPVKNCYAATASETNAYADYVVITTSASSDGSRSTTEVAYSTDNFVSVTGGSEDLHLVEGSDLIGAGTDLSGTFTDDIDGDTRSTWDIGADEYVAEAPEGRTRRMFISKLDIDWNDI